MTGEKPEDVRNEPSPSLLQVSLAVNEMEQAAKITAYVAVRYFHEQLDSVLGVFSFENAAKRAINDDVTTDGLFYTYDIERHTLNNPEADRDKS